MTDVDEIKRVKRPDEAAAHNALMLYDSRRLAAEQVRTVEQYMREAERMDVAVIFNGFRVPLPPEHEHCKDACMLVLVALKDEIERVEKALKSYGFDPEASREGN